MLLLIPPRHLLATLLALCPALSASDYRALVRLVDDSYLGSQMQTCVHLPPGICCRQLNLPHSLTRFASFTVAHFMYMDRLDLGLAWTPDPPAPADEGPLDASAGSPLPNASGCGGRVLDAGSMRFLPLGGLYSFFTSLHAPYKSPDTGRLSIITGASYLRLVPGPGTGLENAEGIRAALGGGGTMFGARNRTGTAAYLYQANVERDVAPDEEVAEEGEGGGGWVWPDQVAVNGTEYERMDGKGALKYRSGDGEVLDLEPWNR